LPIQQVTPGSQSSGSPSDSGTDALLSLKALGLETVCKLNVSPMQSQHLRKDLN